MKTQTNTPNMETGSIPRLLAQLAIPAVVAQIINLLYNIVDRIYIGHIPGIGAAALTGVGLFAPILMLLNAFAMLVGSGGAPRAAIAMGKKDNALAEKILGNCFTLLVGLSIILTIVFYVSAPTLLRLFGASDVTLTYASDYARIYILGSFFVLIVLGMNTFITTQGFHPGSDFYFCSWYGRKGCSTCHCSQSGRRCCMDSPLPDRKENSPSPETKQYASGTQGVWSVPCTWYFYLCHAVNRKSSVDQLYKQSFQIWR